jgi:uncharacterized repeat protein (TIGR04138 family)
LSAALADVFRDLLIVMSTLERSPAPRLRYPRNAYAFLFQALRHTQQKLGKISPASGADDEQEHEVAEDEAHLTGQQLLYGIRDYAREQFGWLAQAVFHVWGIHATDDFGRMVFELVDRGEMRKTDNDHISDFFDVYNFEEVFNRQYELDVRQAFRN